ncbi:tryptophan-rich sensory protein [Kurthia sibirica]|uniref:tryptophan-rich sensory protein n=1 Tax=Kurthia sibirica TaxID=202750 RepID=UPI0011739183|nr:tryptophan-rich sensory protein [Kurthia sibirica]GEK34660.1 hypothetical protein KSI01_21930 [Kurthia sibirica]
MAKLTMIAISFTIMLFASLFANILPNNGHTLSGISDRYTILVFPSKYVYIILVVIYMSILYWIYKQWQMVRSNSLKITQLQAISFTLSMVFHIIWIYYWHQESFIISLIALLLSAGFLAIMYLTMPVSNTWQNRLPISLLLSWVIVTIMLNIAIIIVYYSWSGMGLSQPLWAVILLTVFVAVALHLRFHHHDPAVPFVLIWAYIGVAFHNNFEELLVTTAALFLSGVLAVGIIFMRKSN